MSDCFTRGNRLGLRSTSTGDTQGKELNGVEKTGWGLRSEDQREEPRPGLGKWDMNRYGFGAELGGHSLDLLSQVVEEAQGKVRLRKEKLSIGNACTVN